MYTTISTKYQVVIPKAAREALKLRPRQRLAVLEKDGMLILVPQKPLQAVRGIATEANLVGIREKKDRF